MPARRRKQPPADSPAARPLHRSSRPIRSTRPIDRARRPTSYYIKTPREPCPSENTWVAVQRREPAGGLLAASGRPSFLDNLWIEVIDEPFENGVLGKHVIFHIEERSRVKVVDYVGQGRRRRCTVEVSKIEDKLKEKDIAVHLDSFVDEATIRKVKGVDPRALRREGLQRRRRSSTERRADAGRAEAACT